MSPKPETTRELRLRTLDPNDPFTPGPAAMNRIVKTAERDHGWVVKLLAILVPMVAAAGGWIYRQEALRETVENHGAKIEHLEREVERSGWNTFSLCQALGVKDCEKPGTK